jgi:hypothetical protein
MRRIFQIFASHTLLNTFLLLSLMLLSGVIARAETLQKYREDIENVRGDLSYLYSTPLEEFDETWSKADQIQAEKEFLEDVAKLLPPHETVEWQDIKIEVDNRWLHNRLEAAKALPLDSPERDKIVDELDGRLGALIAKLKELESSPDGTRNKDAEKQKLEQILKRAEYQSPEKEKEESALQRWQKAILDWFRDLLPKDEKVEPYQPQPVTTSVSPAFVQIFVIGLALAVIAFVIWRIAPLFGVWRGRKKEKKGKEERIILGEKLGIDESSSTLFDQAEQMARDGNFRGAIRKGYIALLCELGDRKIVRLAQHKTNRDYLNDVRKNIELHGGMKDLTFMFENHWYGLSSASDKEWDMFREHYRRSTNGI